MNKLWEQKCLRVATITLVFVFGLILRTSEGFRQEFWFHLKGGDSLYFDENVPDLGPFVPLFPSVEGYCARGVWSTFEKVNYVNKYQGMGSESSEEPYCSSINATWIRSLRHFITEETATDALSLFSEIDWAGEEILITGQVLKNISISIGSLGGSGTVDWTLFEGRNLDGISSCFQVPRDGGFYFNWASQINMVNLTQIGSVFRGCNADEIKKYKDQHQQHLN